MSRIARRNFSTWDKVQARFRHFKPGDHVPDYMRVGGHILEPDDTAPPPPSSPPPPAAPPAPPPSAPTFDPSARGVTAKDVHDYLSGLPFGGEGAVEYERVVEAERAGRNRATAIPS